MKRTLFCFDTFVILTPIVLGSVAVAPFIAFDFVRGFAKEKIRGD